MAYQKQEWVDRASLITKERLDHMESGLFMASAGVDHLIEDVTTLTEDINLTNLDIQDLSTNKADKAVVEQSITNISSQLAQNTNLKADKTALQVEKARIDNLIALPDGSTTNDARLEDIKIGANGYVYDSPAEAVRYQIKDVGQLLNDVAYSVRTPNLFNHKAIASGYISYINGTVISHLTYHCSDYMPITVGKTYGFQKIKNQHFSFYNEYKIPYIVPSETPNDLANQYDGSFSTENWCWFIAPYTGYIRVTVDDFNTALNAMMVEADNIQNLYDSYRYDTYIPYYNKSYDMARNIKDLKYANDSMETRIKYLDDELLSVNIFRANLITVYENSNLNATGSIKDGDNIVYEISITGGEYYFGKLNDARDYCIFLDINKQYVTNYTSLGSYGTVVTLPSNVAYCRFIYAYTPIIIKKENYLLFGTKFSTSLAPSVDISAPLSEVLEPKLESLLPSMISPALQGSIIEYINLLNPSNISPGVYVPINGIPSVNLSYDATDYIPIKEGDIYYIIDNNLYPHIPRTLCYYNINKVSIQSAFFDTVSSSSSYIVPWVEGAEYIRITIPAGFADKIMVSKDSSPTSYKTYGELFIRKECIQYEYPPIVEDLRLNKAYSLCGGNSLKVTIPSLQIGVVESVTNFPKNLKKGISITFFSKFDTFTSLTIGKGYNSYRGDWFEIDNTNIVWKSFEQSEYIRKTVIHNLVIDKFLMVAINIDNDSICHCAISTFSGTRTFTFNWTYEQNGYPFVFGGQDMIEVEFGAVANDIKSPIWLFGDSYFGVGTNRIIGQLKNLGYADGCLIDGLAGQGSNGALQELNNLINLGGVPKYLVWCLGMNDSVSAFESGLTNLISLSANIGFELILQKLPVVPSRIDNNVGINTLVESSGCRYIDAFKAVGADNTGTWYDGYLSDDIIHPSISGALSISTRMLIDVPELMQYGYKAGDIGGGISGDM